jgi:hypothetical protein
MPQQKLRSMGAAGREFVIQRYSWEAVGSQMTEVYNWILGGAKPTAVEIV